MFGPAGIFLAYFLEKFPPSFLQQATWASYLWAMSGVIVLWAMKGVMRELKGITVKSSHDAKVVNEQIKVMATTVNAVALALLVIALVQPMANNLAFQLKDGILLFLGLFIHTRTYLVLEQMKPDP